VREGGVEGPPAIAGTPIRVNGHEHRVAADAGTPLIFALRNDLGLKATKLGCALEQCRACTVLVDGEPDTSCTRPLESLGASTVTTLEGFADDARFARLHDAFLEEQAAQCGYCIPGMMMRAQALLRANPNPTDDEIRSNLQTNLCRCGTHMRILKAVRRAAGLMQRADASPTPATGAVR
jgi:nicotinate dehydrogenase subunit A